MNNLVTPDVEVLEA